MKLEFARFIAGAALVVLPLSALASDAPENPIGRFEIARFEVQGNTLLAPSDIEKLLTPFTGKDRDFGVVQRALEALEDAYRQRGFNIVQVALPEQELNQGVIRLNVLEAHIGKVTVEGNKFFDVANIRRSVPGLSEGATPNIANISESLRLANENPAKKVKLQLQNSDNSDDIDSILKVEDEKPWTIGMSLDNTGDANTGRSRVGVLYQNANVGGLDHVLTLQYTTAWNNPDKVSIYGLGYHVPLYAPGDSIDVFGSYSNVDSGSVTAGIFDLQVSGQGRAYGVRYNHNLARVGAYDAKLIFGLDYKAFQDGVLLQGVQLGNDVTVHPVSASYAGSWNLAAGQAGFYVTESFSINPGDVTRFIQQNSSCSVLNRIVGQEPSNILGAMQSNGKVFLINPNGILFGQGARVDVNGLVASTLNLSNEDFLAGKRNFSTGSKAGDIRNQGLIRTPGGGQVYLIATHVENSGIVTSPEGEVVLAAGHSVQLVDSANPDLHVVVSASDSRALNLGQIIAQGGKVGIHGALINQRGSVNANSAVVGQNGKIVFKASGDTMLEAGSRTSATAAGSGGEIHLLGNRVGLVANAIVDASGQTGGGTVLVGGDYHGGNPAIQNATQSYLGPDAEIKADALQSGNGGKVIVWSDEATRAYGALRSTIPVP